jgi:stage III sporulation protein AD
MDIFKIVIIGIVGTVLAVLLSDYRKDFAMMIGLITGIIIFLLVADLLSKTLTSLINMLNEADVQFRYLDVALKIIGVSYLAKFAGQICRDAGEGAIAIKVEMAAKIIILALSLPVIGALIQLVIQILP